MPTRWMITDRNRKGDGLGQDRATTTYWVADDGGKVDNLATWRRVTAAQFATLLAAGADAFPAVPHAENESQKHVTIFVHGYNNGWEDAARRYDDIRTRLFGDGGLGICVLFSWPSDGSPLDYLADREDARACAPDLAEVLGELYDWLVKKQVVADDPTQACRAKTSIIAHSMGNYLLQNAMEQIWTRKNSPLLVSLVNQLLMVAADVDYDLFKSGETVDGSDGDAIANLTYRVTALYSGRDAVLGASAGLKHFGERRLGRSGLAKDPPPSSNVWDADCSRLIPDDVSSAAVHSAYFDADRTLALMRDVLQGIDRGILQARYDV